MLWSCYGANYMRMVSFFLEDKIKLGALYDPRLIPDYGGPCFDHHHAQLKQLNIKDVDGKLVPPWKLYELLKPGTLIIANVTLHCFVFPEGERGRKVRCYFC